MVYLRHLYAKKDIDSWALDIFFINLTNISGNDVPAFCRACCSGSFPSGHFYQTVMKNIAIFSSGSGEAAERVVSLFNEGNRICVRLVVTDRENAGIIGRLQEVGMPVVFLPREQWHESPEEIAALLADNEIELIAFDDFKGVLPAEVETAFAGKTVSLTSPEAAPLEVVKALDNVVEVKDNVKDNATADAEDSPEKGVDEEWAETLKIDYDPSRLRTTPPPVPGARPQAPEIPGNRPESVFGGVRQNYAAQDPGAQMPSTYLIWSVLATVFCCFIPGIVAIIFSSQVSSRYYSGDVEGAKRASDRAQIWIIVSFVLGVLSATLYLPIMMIS